MDKKDVKKNLDDRIQIINAILKKDPLTYTERKVYEGRLLEVQLMKGNIIAILFKENNQIENIEQNQN